MTGAAADDDGDSPVGQRPGAHDAAVDPAHRVCVGAREALEGVVDEGLGIVEHAGHRAGIHDMRELLPDQAGGRARSPGAGRILPRR